MLSLPWRNSWFQLAAFIAAVSGGLLLLDFSSGAKGKSISFPGSFWASLFSPKSPEAGRVWVNSLGQVLRPVTNLNQVLFGQDEVRLKDFTAFFHATGYNAEEGMISLVPNTAGWKPQGATWENPGFSQTENDPVVGISWNDALAFCQWLTNKERSEGRLSANQSYRLPTSAEWNAAIGPTRYPWGDQWPPAPGSGNLGGTEGNSATGAVPGYNDGYARTSPVGTFNANAFGLHDMAGNCTQWTMDPAPDGSAQKLLRGSAWYTSDSDNLLSSAAMVASPDLRSDADGFRIVLQLTASP